MVSSNSWLRREYAISPWLFNMYMDGVMKELRARELKSGEVLKNEWEGSGI